MKYKVAIVDTDSIYLSRISKVFEKKYNDEIILVSYSNWEKFQNSIDIDSFHLILVDETIARSYFISDELPVVFFVSDIREAMNTDGRMAICKFQKHQMIKADMIKSYLEYEARGYYQKKMIYVTSATGGEGTTTLALAMAKKYAQKGKRVLYISLEKNSANQIYFQQPSEYYLTDVLTQIRNDQNIEVTTLEKMITRDETGIFYLLAAKSVFEVNEIRLKEMQIFLKKIRTLGSYDFIILDGMLQYDEFGRDLCIAANSILVVCKETASSITKLQQLFMAFEMWEQLKSGIFAKTNLFFNCHGSKHSQLPNNHKIQILKSIPDYQEETERNMIELLAKEDFLEIEI